MTERTVYHIVTIKQEVQVCIKDGGDFLQIIILGKCCLKVKQLSSPMDFAGPFSLCVSKRRINSIFHWTTEIFMCTVPQEMF